jgi:hypothetical protein
MPPLMTDKSMLGGKIDCKTLHLVLKCKRIQFILKILKGDKDAIWNFGAIGKGREI